MEEPEPAKMFYVRSRIPVYQPITRIMPQQRDMIHVCELCSTATALDARNCPHAHLVMAKPLIQQLPRRSNSPPIQQNVIRLPAPPTAFKITVAGSGANQRDITYTLQPNYPPMITSTGRISPSHPQNATSPTSTPFAALGSPSLPAADQIRHQNNDIRLSNNSPTVDSWQSDRSPSPSTVPKTTIRVNNSNIRVISQQPTPPEKPTRPRSLDMEYIRKHMTQQMTQYGHLVSASSDFGKQSGVAVSQPWERNASSGNRTIQVFQTSSQSSSSISPPPSTSSTPTGFITSDSNRISLRRNPDTNAIEFEFRKLEFNDEFSRSSQRISRTNRDSLILKSPSTPPLSTPHRSVSQVAAFTDEEDSANQSNKIKPFYFKYGAPNEATNAEQEEQINEAFERLQLRETDPISDDRFGSILKDFGYSYYWRMGFLARMKTARNKRTFLNCWKSMSLIYHDRASQFIHLFSQCGRDYLETSDFVPLVQDVVDNHPGLSFLKTAHDFHLRYIHTVISRLFYTVNRSWSGRISKQELEQSLFIELLKELETEPDINQFTEYFSYEHFYVIYCKFWELDTDHDLLIDKDDMLPHDNYGLNPYVIERLFSGAVTKGECQRQGKMTYTEFVWFLISEEDKTTPTAQEYWFRVLDLDGDGRLSLFELEQFWLCQCDRLMSMGIEPFNFQDCVCQLLDMINPESKYFISLSDIKRCNLSPHFFGVFINIHKFLDNELKDPFCTNKQDENGLTDWERYAASEYQMLVSEEALLASTSFNEVQQVEIDDDATTVTTANENIDQ